MGRWKPIFGVIRALVPVLYCGGLIYYFLDGLSLHNAIDVGLGPTLLGLTIVGLVFCIPLFIKVVRLLAGPHAPGSGGGRGPDAPTDDDDGAAAEAAIARYMARRAAETAEASPAALQPRRAGSAERPSFGRKRNL